MLLPFKNVNVTNMINKWETIKYNMKLSNLDEIIILSPRKANWVVTLLSMTNVSLTWWLKLGRNWDNGVDNLKTQIR